MSNPAINQDPAALRRVAALHADVARQWLEAKLRHGAAPTAEAAAEVSSASSQLDGFVAEHPDAPFEELSRSLGLNRFEHDLLLLCWVNERWPEEFFELIPPLQPSRSSPSVTFALAFKLFGGDDRAAMLPHRPLRQFRLVDIVQTSEQGLSTGSLRADEHVVAFADGELLRDGGPWLESMLMLYLRPIGSGDLESLAASHRKIADALVAVWKPGATRHPAGGIAGFHGPDGRGKVDIASAAATAAGRTLFALTLRQIPTHAADIDLLALLWKRDSLLFPLALFVDDASDESAGAEGPSRRAALERLLAQLREFGPVIVASRDPWPGGGAAFTFDVEKPRRIEQQKLWSELLSPALDADSSTEIAGILAWQFNLDSRTIRRIVEDRIRAMADHAGDDPAGAARESLWTACREAARPVL